MKVATSLFYFSWTVSKDVISVLILLYLILFFIRMECLWSDMVTQYHLFYKSSFNKWKFQQNPVNNIVLPISSLYIYENNLKNRDPNEIRQREMLL